VFDGLDLQRVDVGGDVHLRVRSGGSGPPVVLLHGHPRTGDPEAMGVENHADFRAAVHDPDTVRAMLEDYRAGLGVDRAADDADRAAGRQVTCPTLVLWSAFDDLADLYGDVPAIWRAWAPDLRSGDLRSGHHMAEEAPEELAAVLMPFLAGRR
jgi:haloacetate dehalogenase